MNMRLKALLPILTFCLSISWTKKNDEKTIDGYKFLLNYVSLAIDLFEVSKLYLKDKKMLRLRDASLNVPYFMYLGFYIENYL